MPGTPPFRPTCSGSTWNPPYLTGCHYVPPEISGKFAPHPLGWPVYENTTVITPQCAQGSTSPHVVPYCFALDEDPCECEPCCDPEDPECEPTVPPCEAPENSCGYGGDPNCAHSNPYTPRFLNTYTLKDPPEFDDQTICSQRGFKNVFAAKAWHGRRGFSSPCDGKNLGQVKYLTVSRTANFTNTSQCNPSNTTYARAASIDRYTGEVIGVSCSGEEIVPLFIADHCGDRWQTNTFIPGFGNDGYELDHYLNDDYLLDECEELNGINGPHLPCGWEIEKSIESDGNSETLHIKVTVTWPEACNIYGVGPCGVSIGYICADFGPCAPAREIAAAQHRMNCAGGEGAPCDPLPSCSDCEPDEEAVQFCEDGQVPCLRIDEDTCIPICDIELPCPTDGPEDEPFTTTYEVTVVLSNPYTADDVDADCRALLSDNHWNLADDAQYPWRTDTNVSSGPLMTYAENIRLGGANPDGGWNIGCPCEEGEEDCVDPVPRPNLIYGSPIQKYLEAASDPPAAFPPASYEPWFNSEHENMEYTDPLNVGVFCWRVQSWGAASPFPNATQWMPDYVSDPVHGTIIPPGANAFYSSPYMIGGSTEPGCFIDKPVFQGCLVLSKWAEIYLHEFPSHNYARPCGAEDRAAVDWSLLDCEESNPRNELEWPRDARWPNEDTPTTDVPNDNKGSDVSCYCNHVQPEQTEVTDPPDAITCRETEDDPHCCAANDDPAALEKILAPPDTADGNTPTKVAYGYNDADRKGDASIKTWKFVPIRSAAAALEDPPVTIGNLESMTCTAVCFSKMPCRPSAIFIQPTPPTGRYEDALHVVNPSVALRDDDYGSTGSGEWALVQFDQAMLDFLWQHPRLPCPDGGLDPDAVIPFEENRDCADGYCLDYVAWLDGGGSAKDQCQPREPKPWSYVPEIEF